MSDNAPVKRGRGRPPKDRTLEKKYGVELPEKYNSGNIEPGDNAKFLTHALTIRSWPDIEIKDPVQVEQRIQDYFELCAMDDIKPSVKGFLNSLRVAKSTLWEWRQGNFRAGTHQAIICAAYDVLEALWEDYMQNGKINPVSGIFLGKNNYGYTDKQEFVLTPNQNQITPEDLATIESKYDELPE